MKNIHLIHVNRAKASLYHCSNTRDFFTTRQTPDDLLYELYITNSEEIKEGDWLYSPAAKEVLYASHDMLSWNSDTTQEHKGWKKIILTTDPKLIEDGVQPIDDEFLEWFVKNPSCEEVEVGYGWIRLTETNNEGYWVSIPDNQFEMQQEEPKQATKCYCGHTTYCDCGPEQIKKQKAEK
jgi:hypothetical protein